MASLSMPLCILVIPEFASVSTGSGFRYPPGVPRIDFRLVGRLLSFRGARAWHLHVAAFGDGNNNRSSGQKGRLERTKISVADDPACRTVIERTASPLTELIRAAAFRHFG